MSTDHGLVLSRLSLSSATWWSGAIAGTALLLLAVVRGGPHLALGGPALAMTAALLLVLELRPIIASGRYDPHGVTLSTAFVFALLFMWGLWPAVIAQSLATFASETRKRKPLAKWLFNIGQYNVSLAAAWLVMHLAGVAPTLQTPLHALHGADIWWVVTAWLVYFWTNNVLVSGVLSYGDTFRENLTSDLGYYVTTTFPVLALSPVVVVLAEHAWGMLPLLLIPLALVYKTASMSLQQEHLAGHDPLTGLPNRASFQTALGDTLGAAERSGEPCSLFLVDLDGFKEVNDTLGHGVGDQLLVAFAERLRSTTRLTGTVARLGGDEFAVILPDAEEDGAVRAAARVTRALAAPLEVAGHTLTLRASVGISVFPRHAADAETLLQLADVAMYVAKNAGTGVAVYDPRADRFAGDRERAQLV
jgi:diguanylate cyclase (GGDEF)-like protein